MRRDIACLVLSLAVSDSAYSFDLDGFNSGMSFAAARKLVESRAYDHVDVKEDDIGAWDAPNRTAPRTVFLTFCKGRLVTVQKFLPPHQLDRFVRLVDEYRKRLGRPIDALSQPALDPPGAERSALVFVWRDGSEFVIVSFTQFKTNNQLDIVHQAPNECWRTPYYGG